jgi:hypothetical protein
VKSWQLELVLLGVMLVGCSSNTDGTEAAARKYFNNEFRTWMAGETSSVATKRSQRMMFAPPISYDIRSIVPSDPDFLACQDTANLPKDWNSWPAFKLNVAIEWKSEEGTPLTKVTSYLLTWNTAEKRWYATEQF